MFKLVKSTKIWLQFNFAVTKNANVKESWHISLCESFFLQPLLPWKSIYDAVVYLHLEKFDWYGLALKIQQQQDHPFVTLVGLL